MPKVWRTPKPDPALFEAELRALVPHLNAPVIGKEAIRQWLFDHGFRGHDGGPPKWGTIKAWQKRVGEPLLFHAPQPRVHCTLGPPVSSVLVLTRWCMCQSHKVGPRNYVDWVPSRQAARQPWRRKAKA